MPRTTIRFYFADTSICVYLSIGLRIGVGLRLSKRQDICLRAYVYKISAFVRYVTQPGLCLRIKTWLRIMKPVLLGLCKP